MTNSTPQARAWRLQRLRNCTGLSRTEFESRHGISANTIRGWETVCHGGLTENGARIFLEAIKKEGVLCDIQWLLYGGENTPYISPNAFNQEINNKHVSEETLIQGEISALKVFYKTIIILNIQENTLSPMFNTGDIVIGNPTAQEDENKFQGKPCIIIYDNGEKTIKIPIVDKTIKKITLLDVNSKEAQNIKNLEITAIAPILWHRKRI